MFGILAEVRRHFGVPDGVRPFHGGHPRVSFEVAGCGEAGDVPLEIKFVPAGLALGAIYEESVDLHGSFFTPLKKATLSLRMSDAFFKDVRRLF